MYGATDYYYTNEPPAARPQLTPEELQAKVLDGTATDAERAAVLRQLNEDDEALEVYGRAAAVTREVEIEDRTATNGDNTGA